MTRLILIRHAPILHDAAKGAVLCGRTDPGADLSDGAGLARLAAALPKGWAVRTSPALRARQTAAALGLAGVADAALWEQDFGDWDGLPYGAIPDLGPLDSATLAAHRPPGGESFADLCARVAPALAALQTDTIVVCHAGVIRAALAMALGPVAGTPAAGLAFRIDAPSLTEIARVGSDTGSHWAICRVNITF